MSYRFKRSEKLKSKKLIDQLFDQGKSIRQGPIKLIYLEIAQAENQAGFAVPKKLVPKAVSRNTVKRKLREAYRLHKHLLSNPGGPHFAMMFLYLSSKKPAYGEVEQSVIGLINKLQDRSAKK